TVRGTVCSYRRSGRVTNEAGPCSSRRGRLRYGAGDGRGITESGGRFRRGPHVLRAQGPPPALPALLPMPLDKGKEDTGGIATGRPAADGEGRRKWPPDRPRPAG